jgi:hypothetical protein
MRNHITTIGIERVTIIARSLGWFNMNQQFTTNCKEPMKKFKKFLEIIGHEE